MRSEDAFGTGATVGCFTGLILGMLLMGFMLGPVGPKLREEAIKYGYAEYVITNPATGTTEWRWKEGK